MKKLLVVVSHPSDESFVFGGMIAKYAKVGWDIRLLLAVNGGKGDPSGEIRQKELDRAGKILGISEIRTLGFFEGNLMSISPGTLEDILEKYMKDMLPDIVVTFGTLGINNNPDHVKVCYATTYAYQKYAAYLHFLSQSEITVKGRGKEWKQFEFRRAFGETGGHEKESKLYYACYPTSQTEYLQKIKSLPLESFGKPWVGTQDKNITTVIDISSMKSKKMKALSSYESLKDDVSPFLSFEKNPYLIQEYYLLRMQGIYEVYMGKTDKYAKAL